MWNIIEYQEQYRKDVIELVISIFVEEFGFENYRESYEKLDIMKNIENGGQCWIAIEDNKVIGTIMFINNLDNTGRLQTMYVKEEYRGKGLSKELFDVLLQYAIKNEFEKIFLGTYDRLARAISFYKRLGFVEYEKEKYTHDDRYFYLDLQCREEKYA